MKFTVIRKTAPIQNESLDSYLYRIGNANYYETSNWYKIVFGLNNSINPNQFSDPFLIDKVSKFLRFSSSDIESMTIRSIAKNIVGKEKFSESDTLKYITKMTRVKLCPFCYKENHAELLPWKVRSLTACPKHHVRLIDSCPNCHKQLHRTNRCPYCHIEYVEKATLISDDSIAILYTKLIWSAITTNSSLPFSQSALQFPELTSSDFIQLVHSLGNLLVGYDGLFSFVDDYYVKNPEKFGKLHRSKNRHTEDVMHISGCCITKVLSNWPDEFRKVLAKLLIIETEKLQKSEKGDIFPIRFIKLDLPASCKNLFWNEIVKFVEKTNYFSNNLCYWQNFINFSNKRTYSLKKQLDPFLIQKSVAEILPNKQVSAILGVSKNFLGELICNSYFLPTTFFDNKKVVGQFFTNESVLEGLELLFGKMQFLEHSKTDSVRYFFSTSTGKSFGYGFSIFEFLEAIISGKYQVFRNPQKNGMAGIWMYEVEYEKFLDDYRVTPKLEIEELSSILHCDTDMCRLLIKRGFLNVSFHSASDKYKNSISQLSFNIFTNRYIKIEDVSKIFQVSTQRILNWINTGKIYPCSGPTIDGFCEYLFNKIQVIQMKHALKNENEVCDLIGIDQVKLISLINNKVIIPIREMGSHPLLFRKSDVLIIDKNLRNRNG